MLVEEKVLYQREPTNKDIELFRKMNKNSKYIFLINLRNSANKSRKYENNKKKEKKSY